MVYRAEDVVAHYRLLTHEAEANLRRWNGLLREAKHEQEQAFKEAHGYINQVSNALLGASAASAGLIMAGVQVAGTWEQAEIAFENMLGSAARGQRMLDDLATFARRSGQQVMDVVRSAQMLMNAGIGADQVIPAMQAISAASVNAGRGAEGFRRIANALAQIQAKGTVNAEEMTQQLGEVLPAWQILAEQLGRSVQETKEMAQDGMLTAAEAVPALIAGMTARYGALIDRQADTTFGKWNAFLTDLQMMARESEDTLLPLAKTSIDFLSKLLQVLQHLDPQFVVFTTVLLGAAGAAGKLYLAGTQLQTNLAILQALKAKDTQITREHTAETLRNAEAQERAAMRISRLAAQRTGQIIHSQVGPVVVGQPSQEQLLTGMQSQIRDREDARLMAQEATLAERAAKQQLARAAAEKQAALAAYDHARATAAQNAATQKALIPNEAFRRQLLQKNNALVSEKLALYNATVAKEQSARASLTAAQADRKLALELEAVAAAAYHAQRALLAQAEAATVSGTASAGAAGKLLTVGRGIVGVVGRLLGPALIAMIVGEIIAGTYEFFHNKYVVEPQEAQARKLAQETEATKAELEKAKARAAEFGKSYGEALREGVEAGFTSSGQGKGYEIVNQYLDTLPKAMTMAQRIVSAEASAAYRAYMAEVYMLDRRAHLLRQQQQQATSEADRERLADRIAMTELEIIHAREQYQFLAKRKRELDAESNEEKKKLLAAEFAAMEADMQARQARERDLREFERETIRIRAAEVRRLAEVERQAMLAGGRARRQLQELDGEALLLRQQLRDADTEVERTRLAGAIEVKALEARHAQELADLQTRLIRWVGEAREDQVRQARQDEADGILANARLAREQIARTAQYRVEQAVQAAERLQRIAEAQRAVRLAGTETDLQGLEGEGALAGLQAQLARATDPAARRRLEAQIADARDQQLYARARQSLRAAYEPRLAGMPEGPARQDLQAEYQEKQAKLASQERLNAQARDRELDATLHSIALTRQAEDEAREAARTKDDAAREAERRETAAMIAQARAHLTLLGAVQDDTLVRPLQRRLELWEANEDAARQARDLLVEYDRTVEDAGRALAGNPEALRARIEGLAAQLQTDLDRVVQDLVDKDLTLQVDLKKDSLEAAKQAVLDFWEKDLFSNPSVQRGMQIAQHLQRATAAGLPGLGPALPAGGLDLGLPALPAVPALDTGAPATPPLHLRLEIVGQPGMTIDDIKVVAADEANMQIEKVLIAGAG